MRKHEVLYLPMECDPCHLSPFCPYPDPNMGFCIYIEVKCSNMLHTADDGTDEFLAGPQRVVKEWERMDVS